jgi:hypothetical protein
MKRLFVPRTPQASPGRSPISAFSRLFAALWWRTAEPGPQWNAVPVTVPALRSGMNKECRTASETRKVRLRGHLWRAYILRRFSISNSNGGFLTLGTPPHACGPCVFRRTPCSLIRNARSSWRHLPGK